MDAFSYQRVSSKEQEEEGFSIPAQRAFNLEYAEKKGLRIVRDFTEAMTAKRAGRRQFSKMMEALKEPGAPKVVIVEKTDRLYRNFRDYVLIEELIIEHGIEIHLAKEGEVLSKDSNSHTKLIHGVKLLMAKNYIDNLSEETRKGMYQKAREGGWSVAPPYGYRMDKETGELVPDENADFVREAFRIYSRGTHSLEETRKLLRERGHQFRPYQPTIPKGNLERMLKRRAYVGDVEFKGEIFPGRHEPLVSPATWEKVQLAFRKDGKPLANRKHIFRYSGLITCGECGRVVTAELKKGGKYTYYRCSAMRRGCSQGYIREEELDIQFERYIYGLRFPDWMKERIRETVLSMDETKEETESEEIRAITRELTDAKRKLKRIYHDRLANLIDENLWREMTAEYQETVRTLEGRLRRMSEADLSYCELGKMLIELPNHVRRRWFRGSDARKSVLLKLLCSNLTLRDGILEIELLSPFSDMVETAKNRKWGRPWDDVRKILSQSETIRAIYEAVRAA